jgi:hypothetical protein
MVGGPPLAAARQAGEDSISSWRKVPAPDFVRQRWAILEIFTRVYSANRQALDHSTRALDRSLADLADGCAHRSQLLGWRGAAIAGYRLGARFAWARHDYRGAALRLTRAVRCGALGRTADPSLMPGSIALLRQRAERYARAILEGTALKEDPLPIEPGGAWSTLAVQPTG